MNSTARNKTGNKTSPHDGILSISTYAGEVSSVGCKLPKPKKTEVHCTSIFKNPANISVSINKLWAEVIYALENASGTGYNENIQRHAYPNSDEFEVGNI